MPNKLTIIQVIALLERHIEKAGSLRKLALKMGLSAAYVSDVTRMAKEPGPAICEYLNLRRVKVEKTYYERVK